MYVISSVIGNVSVVAGVYLCSLFYEHTSIIPVGICVIDEMY